MVMAELTVEFLEVHAAGSRERERDAAPSRTYRESRTERGPFHERRKRVRDVPRLPTKWRASSVRSIACYLEYFFRNSHFGSKCALRLEFKPKRCTKVHAYS